MKSVSLGDVEVPIIIVKRLRDAIGAICRDCEMVSAELVPWHWSKSKALHERGMEHKMDYFMLAPTSEAIHG